MWLYLLTNKDEVFTVFCSFHTMTQTQFSAKLRVFSFDNGTEYMNRQFQKYFHQHGLIHQTSCPHTPEQNGVVERKNRHILETTRVLLLSAHVPSPYWPNAVTIIVHLINRMTFQILDFKTPLQALASSISVLSTMTLLPRTFGCVVYVHLHCNQRTKLDPCACRCLFLGYATNQKGYWCYDPTNMRLYVTMDVTFLESEMFYHPSNSSLKGKTHDEELNWFKDIPDIPLITEPPTTMDME